MYKYSLQIKIKSYSNILFTYTKSFLNYDSLSAIKAIKRLNESIQYSMKEKNNIMIDSMSICNGSDLLFTSDFCLIISYEILAACNNYIIDIVSDCHIKIVRRLGNDTVTKLILINRSVG
jgi:hypothetical protein